MVQEIQNNEQKVNMDSLAPVVVFAYNRPAHLERTLQALANNDLSDQSELIVFCDGPRENATTEQITCIKKVREVAKSRNWCKMVTVIESDYNKGLAESIVEGVKSVVDKYGKVIVLEDDIVTTKGFLKYMNAALDMYENEDKVMHISGYMYPHKRKLGDTFFCALPMCWGWATWDRAWRKYDGNAEKWWNYFEDNQLWDRFNVFGGTILQKQLKDNVKGIINTWFVKWHSSVLYNNGLALFPGQSLVDNIGMDNSGVHCVQSNRFTNSSLTNYVVVNRKPLKESKKGRRAIKLFYQGHWYSKRNRVKVINLFNSLFTRWGR